MNKGKVSDPEHRDYVKARQIKPIYPEFPKECISLLPPELQTQDLEHVISCFCATCMPRVWDNLAPHPRPWEIPFHNIGGCKLAMYFNLHLDLPTLMSTFMTNLSRLEAGHFTVQEYTALNGIKKWGTRVRDVMESGRDMSHPAQTPNLQRFGDLLNTLCFAGHLAKVNYEWKKPGDGPMTNQIHGYSVARESLVVLNADMYAGTGHYEDWSSFERLEIVLGTVIHEQIHVYFGRYLCNGHCFTRIRAQNELCKYLFAREYDEFAHVLYKESQTLETMHFSGHGPAFLEVARGLERLMTKLLDLPEELELYTRDLDYQDPERKMVMAAIALRDEFPGKLEMAGRSVWKCLRKKVKKLADFSNVL